MSQPLADRGPISVIRNKPHIRGLLTDGALSKTTKTLKSIFWHMEILFNSSDRSPVKSMQNILQRWSTDQHRPTIVADSAFSSFEVMEKLTLNHRDAITKLKPAYSGAAGLLLSSYFTRDGVVSFLKQNTWVMSDRRNNIEKRRV